MSYLNYFFKGPLLMSPDNMLSSFKREVVFKISDIYKGSLLRDLRKIFRDSEDPFYAGFGNRNTVIFYYYLIK